jgi:uncharacterized membrane protein
MTERNAPDEMNEAPVFEALLTPHRSLGRRGFALLMILFTGLCMFDGFIFLMAGAWPILGFCGLEVLLLFGAFLNPDDRESFASAFSGALATVKRR